MIFKKTGIIRNPFATSGYLLRKKMKRITPYITGTLLDYGAGYGQYTRLLRKKGFTVDCYEPDPEMRDSSLEYIETPTKQYDTIILINVLHHVKDEPIQVVKDLLTIGNRIIIGELNGDSWLVRYYHRLFLKDEVGLHMPTTTFAAMILNLFRHGYIKPILELCIYGVDNIHMLAVIERRNLE